MYFRFSIILFISTIAYSFSTVKAISPYYLQPLYQQPDTISTTDTSKKPKKKPIEDPIFYVANDSLNYSIDGKKVFLYGDAKVNYQKLELKAQYIEFDMNKKEVFAKGLPDSTGKIIGRPIFKEGSQTFEMDDIHYNFDTKRAKITGVITEESGGYMHGKVTKKMENNVVNISGGKYTTCDQVHPHFYIAISKGKVIPNDKIISGPAHLVIEDVPLPLGIPFGFFPNTRKRASGIILPEYGEENNRGIYLKHMGFYFGISDYFDLKLSGDIYSKGSWALSADTRYKRRYKYSGTFGVNVSTNILGEKGLPDYNKQNTYQIRWNHSQDPKAHPNSTFQANVTFGSSNHNKYNSTNINNYLTNTITSSISYSKVFVGTPFTFSTSLNHSQNNITKEVNLGFPKVSFNMSRIYPFKKKSSIGKPKWYEKIGLSLSSSLDNRVTVMEDNLFKPSVIDSMKNGMKHDIPISTSFNILKYITVSPSVSYSEYWYTKTIHKSWNEDSLRVDMDTISGFKRGYQYSSGISMSTKLYGMFNFGNKYAIQAIRHVVTPSVSLSYRPDFSDPSYGFFKPYQVNKDGKMSSYSIFEQGIYGGPSGGKSGMVSFSLSNNLEMKVRSSQDTVTNTKKIKLLESFGASTSYNLLADSLNWSDIAVNARTNLFEKVNVSFSGAFSLYALDEKGKIRKDFQHSVNGQFARFTRASIGVDFSLNSKKGKEDAKDNEAQAASPPMGTYGSDTEFGQSLGTDYANLQYVDFNVPWNLRVNYSFSYSKPAYERSITQTLGFSGDINLTPKWKIGFSSGYDFKNKKLTTTSFNFYRDLHCWEMRLSFIPIGFRKSYSFQINIKSSILQDIKWNKRDHFLDNL